MTPIWKRLNVEQLLTRFIEWLPALFSAIVIFVLFWVAFRLTRPAIARVLARAGFDPALAGMVLNVYRFTLMAFGIIMGVNQLGINVGAALAGLGVVGLTIGFAAKDSLSNIMAGFLIFWDKPFHAGDWVTLGDNYGKVAEVTMRTTRLLTWSNTWVIIPNDTVINQILVNHSRGGQTRIEVPLSIAPKGDLTALRESICAAVRQVKGVLQDPPPAVMIKALGPAETDLVIHAWISDPEQERPVFFRVLDAAKPVVDAAA
jgi:small conductance mechanosensitive channel